MRPFSKLVEMGYGTDSAAHPHPVLGKPIWQYSGQNVQLQFFDRGFVYTDEASGSVSIEYFSITRIDSSLTVRKISATMGSYTGQEALPIYIQTDRLIKIVVPLVIYSSILQGLNLLVAEPKKNQAKGYRNQQKGSV